MHDYYDRVLLSNRLFERLLQSKINLESYGHLIGMMILVWVGENV